MEAFWIFVASAIFGFSMLIFATTALPNQAAAFVVVELGSLLALAVYFILREIRKGRE